MNCGDYCGYNAQKNPTVISTDTLSRSKILNLWLLELAHGYHKFLYILVTMHIYNIYNLADIAFLFVFLNTCR